MRVGACAVISSESIGLLCVCHVFKTSFNYSIASCPTLIPTCWEPPQAAALHINRQVYVLTPSYNTSLKRS